MSLGIDIDQNVDWLEDVLDEECKCESRHEGWVGQYKCSVAVVAYRKTACGLANGLVCQSVLRGIAEVGWCKKCTCRDEVNSCWSLVPV